MLAFALALVSVLFVAAAAAGALRLPSVPARLVAAYLCVVAQVIIVGEILGLAGQLHRHWFLLAHVGTTALVLWRGAAFAPFRAPGWRGSSGHARRGARWPLVRYPDLLLLGIAVVLAYLIGLALVLTLPPNNWDSMNYHLTRVGYWLQRHAFYPPWNPGHAVQTMYPVNAELLALWTVIFIGHDGLTGLIQWSAAIAGMIAIFGVARLWRASRAQAAFAALIWATLPQIALQSTTTQNDLLAAVFLLAACYFSVIGLCRAHPGALVVAGIALGLAVGTKVTVLMALPGIALAALLLALRRGLPRQRLAAWIGACVAGVIGLGLHSYVANCFIYGHPFGPPGFRRITSTGRDLGPTLFVENAAKYLYQAADLNGVYRRLMPSLSRARVEVGRAAFAAAGIDPGHHHMPTSPPFALDTPVTMHEDLAWFGPLGLLLLFPVAAWQAVQSLRRGNESRVIVAAGAVSFVLIACAWLRWQLWSGRYFVVAATLAAPLLAMAYRDHRAAWLRWPAVLIAIVCLVEVVLTNKMKPLAGTPAIWGRDRVAMQTIGRPALEPLLRALEREVPAGARVGTLVRDDWDYPAFGRHFDRTVVPLARQRPTRAALAALDLDYVLLRRDMGLDLGDVVDGRGRSWHSDTLVLVELDRHGRHDRSPSP